MLAGAALADDPSIDTLSAKALNRQVSVRFTMAHAFDSLFQQTTKGVAVEVTKIPQFSGNVAGQAQFGATTRVPASLLKPIRNVPGVRMAVGSVTFSLAESVGTRLNAWKTNPILSRRRSVSCFSLIVVRSASPTYT